MTDQPMRHQARILRAMREGHVLQVERAKDDVAMLGNLRPIEFHVIEELVESGWIYELGTPGKERVWQLTIDGLKALL